MSETLKEVERLRKYLLAIHHCLNYIGPLNEYEVWARDLATDALGGWAFTKHPNGQSERPLTVVRLLLGDDYPEDGWEDGERPKRKPEGWVLTHEGHERVTP